MEAVAEIAAHRGVPCEVSLETPMACGIGICFSCVARVHQPQGGWDYKRTCVEGPILIEECRFMAGVPLPSGALIEYMEFAVCDPDPDGFGAAQRRLALASGR